MVSFRYVVKDELGIHARPAGLLAKEAKKYASKIKIKKGDKEVLASQLLGLMGLGVKKDDEVLITVEGEEEEKALDGMKAFFEANL